MPSLDHLARIVADLQADLRLIRTGLVRLAAVNSPTAIRFAKLNGNLATGGLTTPSTATGEFYASSTDDPPELSASGDTFTVVNYSEDYSGATGDFIIVARIQGVWHIIAADC